MYQDAFEAVCNAAKAKTNLFKKNPLGYFVSAMVAGMFIAFGAFISNAAAAPFADAQDPMQKFMNSMTFSAALSMVLMAGADLFTEITSSFPLRLLPKDEMERCGEDLGGMLSWKPGGKPDRSLYFPGQRSCFRTVGQLFAAAAEKKMTAPAINLVLKGLLCNTLVCIAVWCSIKLKSEAGKLIMIMWCILTFMLCGFEHSIANMTTMAVGMMNSTSGTLTIGGYIYNLVCVTIGNMIGGVVFVALPYYLISKKTEA